MDANAISKNNTLLSENWCYTRTKEHYCSFTWTIDHYSDYHYRNKLIEPFTVDQRLESSIFQSTTNDKCLWNLQLDPPKNDKVDAKILLNCFQQWCEEVSVKYELSILNAKKEKANVRKLIGYSKLSKGSSRYYVSIPGFLIGSNISDEAKSWLVDGKLTIFCELQFVMLKSAYTNISGKSVAIQESSICKDLRRMFDEQLFSDLTISVGEKEFKVHKNILAARSTVFAAMLEQNMKERNENRIEIDGMDENVVEEMLRYIYHEETPNIGNTDMALHLLMAADKYDLQSLKIRCQHEVMKKLSVENVVDCLILADLHNAALLKEEAVRCLKCNLEEVMKIKGSFWCKLVKSDVFNEIFDYLFIVDK